MSNQQDATIKALELELVQGIVNENSHGENLVDINSDAAVRACISTKHVTSLAEIKKLKTELILRHVCEDRPLFPFLQIAATLHDACLKPGTRTAETDWEEAIRIVLANIQSLSVYNIPTESLMLSES